MTRVIGFIFGAGCAIAIAWIVKRLWIGEQVRAFRALVDSAEAEAMRGERGWA